MSDELKQCTFCGSDYVLTYEEGDYGYLEVIQCQKCGIQFILPGEDTQHTINAWNSRHEPDDVNRMRNLLEDMTDEKICPFMSNPGTQMYTIGLVDSVYCQKDRCMAWEPHPKVDEYDTFEGGRCRLIP